MQPLKLGVSACLLGDRVRYDGLAKLNNVLLANLPNDIECYKLCPEVGAGLSVPRPAVQLVDVQGKIKMLGLDDARLDVTEVLEQYVVSFQPMLAELSGLLLKSRSPSCGVIDTPLYSSTGDVLKWVDGYFVHRVRTLFPNLPLLSDDVFGIAVERLAFFEEMQRYAGRLT